MNERPLVAAVVVVGIFLVGGYIAGGEWTNAVLVAALFVFGVVWLRKQLRGRP